MKSYPKILGVIPAILVTIFIVLSFKSLLFSANDFMYFNNGDALKNYLHFSLYAKNGSGFHINEVNYPFGEHVVFLDNQPILAFIANKLGLGNYAVSIIHLLPFFSLILTAFILFLIQRFLGLPLLINIISSSIISLLSPQVLRFESHHALSYTFVIPLMILLLLYANKSKLWLIPFVFITVFISYIHLYYLFITLVFAAAYALLILVKRKRVKFAFLIISSALISFALVKGILNYTDNVNDRAEPFYNATYRSTFEGVFLPQEGRFADFLKEKIHVKSQSLERVSYVGKLGIPVLSFMLLAFIYRLFKKRSTVSLFHNTYLFELSWAACFVWLFAMYFPFKGIIDIISQFVPAFKQFRSLGRLAWVFFYVFSILMSFKFYHFYSYLKTKTNIVGASLIFIFIAVIWSSDIDNHFNFLKQSFQNRHHNIFSNLYQQDNYEELAKLINFKDYQASLALPLFHIGSEIKYYYGSDKAIRNVFSLAYFYDLPFISTLSSRASKRQFLTIEKSVLTGDLSALKKNNKAILIVADVDFLNPTDSVIIEKSTFLYKKNNISYYRYSHF